MTVESKIRQSIPQLRHRANLSANRYPDDISRDFCAVLALKAEHSEFYQWSATVREFCELADVDEDEFWPMVTVLTAAQILCVHDRLEYTVLGLYRRLGMTIWFYEHRPPYANDYPFFQQIFDDELDPQRTKQEVRYGTNGRPYVTNYEGFRNVGVSISG